MVCDPDCVGEVLLLAMVIARVVDLGDPFPITDGVRMRDFRIPAYGDRRFHSDLLIPASDQFYTRNTPDSGWGRVASVIRHDVPRYAPPRHRWHCDRPRVRSEGLCGRSASQHIYLTDPATGLKEPAASCSQNQCKKWLDQVRQRNRQACRDNPPPRPPFNTGGILERHLPEIDWWALYKHFYPDWVAMTEPDQKPKLRLVVGGPDDTDPPDLPATGAGKPALTVIVGGWPELTRINPPPRKKETPVTAGGAMGVVRRFTDKLDDTGKDDE